MLLVDDLGLDACPDTVLYEVQALLSCEVAPIAFFTPMNTVSAVLI